jgi:phage shock protein E
MTTMNKTVTVILFIALSGCIVLGLLLYPWENGELASDDELAPENFIEKLHDKPGVIIDVRTLEEYVEGHLAMTDYHLDFLAGEIEKEMDNLDRNETYYLYCRTGNRSGQAMEIMRDAGFMNVYNIGGYEDLISSGLPSKKGK